MPTAGSLATYERGSVQYSLNVLLKSKSEEIIDPISVFFNGFSSVFSFWRHVSIDDPFAREKDRDCPQFLL